MGTRHSFIQIGKITNVKGRIEYIGSKAKQENLYATFDTADTKYWKTLAKESQQEFQKSGTAGKCIEARELIIALPEIYIQFDPNQVLEEFTNSFKELYGVECVSALHHNKRKTNYHIHLIFSERKLLEEPEQKIAQRNRYYNEQGKYVKTKKEVLDENKQIREGCRVIAKGAVYEQRLFSNKDPRFKSETFLDAEKKRYTKLINSHIENPNEKLQVFEKGGVYLPTKKIGKNNPRQLEIEKDNLVRKQWNQTVDIALVEGVSEREIMITKKIEITNKVEASIIVNGKQPNLFQIIILKAIKLLGVIIRKFKLPKRPEPTINLHEFEKMKQIHSALVNQSRLIRQVVDKELPGMRSQLESTGTFFKHKERKQLKEKIAALEEQIPVLKEQLKIIVKKHGYESVRDFMKLYNLSEKAVVQYEYDLKKWEKTQIGNPPKESSVKAKLRKYQEEIGTRKKSNNTKKCSRGDNHGR